MPHFALRSLARAAMFIGVVSTLIGTPAVAQPSAKRAPAAAATPTIVGQWVGKATVPLPDSTIVVPVFYTFTQTAGSIGGNAMVPGQGTGPISHVVQNGSRIQFRVTAPEGKLLEHDGTFNADGSIEGMVNLDNAPVAKFKISPKPAAAPAK